MSAMPERSDLTVDQHRMVAPSRVWLMPPPGDPTWYAGSWKSNPLTVVVGDVPYVPEAEVQRLRAEVEAAKWTTHAIRVESILRDRITELEHQRDVLSEASMAQIGTLDAALARLDREGT